MALETQFMTRKDRFHRIKSYETMSYEGACKKYILLQSSYASARLVFYEFPTPCRTRLLLKNRIAC